jgi:hypothetical protein
MNYKWQIIFLQNMHIPTEAATVLLEEVGLKIPVLCNAVLHSSISGSQYSERMCHLDLQKHGEQLTQQSNVTSQENGIHIYATVKTSNLAS